MADFRNSKLWISAFAARDGDQFSSARDRLRAAYEGFWERGVRLAQRISSDLPGLTLHDEAHLSALWDRASQLISDNFEINPLEVFVFGGALILHDAGHAIAAYEGGLAELKQTIEYKDAVAGILRRKGANPPSAEEIQNAPKDIENTALFFTLRRLHAKRAKTLATRSFGGNYLIDDTELRESLGQLIGEIAASHHLDRASLQEKLQERRGPPGCMPRVWGIQVIKLACLLRCADAIQIDQCRTPAFAQALHAPSGESELHWLAQQLAQPMVRLGPDDLPGSLEFTSQNAFPEDHADAWWIAYDLVQNANRELEGCYQMMKNLGLPAFTVDRIAGAESPAKLQKFIRVSGWKPIVAEVRVTNVEHIVRLFGGEHIYGRDVAVPLRELIQNASDAIRARRKFANDSSYEGRIVVGLKSMEDGFFELTVEDDGIGMAEHILAGPLIEFGKSFWASDEAGVEFPGLGRVDKGDSQIS